MMVVVVMGNSSNNTRSYNSRPRARGITSILMASRMTVNRRRDQSSRQLSASFYFIDFMFIYLTFISAIHVYWWFIYWVSLQLFCMIYFVRGVGKHCRCRVLKDDFLVLRFIWLFDWFSKFMDHSIVVCENPESL